MVGFTHLPSTRSTACSTGRSASKTCFPKVTELGMETVAVTDHGNMFGAIDLTLLLSPSRGAAKALAYMRSAARRPAR